MPLQKTDTYFVRWRATMLSGNSICKMTDKEYIDGIRNKDNRIFATLYETFRSDFINLFRIKHNDIERLLMPIRIPVWSCGITYKKRNANNLSEDYRNSQFLLQEELSERETIIQQLVADMQEPCNTLLKLYYFGKRMDSK